MPVKSVAMGHKKIKILYIADSTSIHTQRWIEYFVNRGYEIYLITIGRKCKILTNVHHVINFDQFYYNSLNFFRAFLNTRKIIHSIQPDILHAHFIHQFGWLGALSGYHPFVLTVWGTDVFQLPRVSRLKLGKWLTRYALRTADAITTTSSAATKEAISLGAVDKKIEVIFWGVDTKKFRPDISTHNIRKQLMIADNVPVILSNRNYASLYNNDIVIKAVAQVLKFYPNAILILQNAGGKAEGETELKILAEQTGITKSVRFLPQYHHEELPPLYALADIYVSVPTWDAGPVSLKEAMASHCAPIISQVSGPMEWIIHEKNGIVVPVKNIEMLSQAICELISNKEKRARFNKLNRKLIVEKADHKKQMEKVEDLYHRII